MNLKTALALGYQTARSASFAGQLLSLPWLERLATGEKTKTPENITERRKEILQALGQLLKEDSENIGSGMYPIEVLKPEGPAEHWLRFGRIIVDGMKITRRRKLKDHQDFSSEAKDYMKDVPEYYRRNFHFQTGGYLTQESADLYEHQVEILFAGGGDAMRRLMLPLLKAKYPGDGEGLHFLEIAAGTGRLTRFVKLAFPKARITVSDVSWPYLQTAQKRLFGLDRLEFVQAPAEKLPFQDGIYDAVFSCFLFHELPSEIRRQVVAEGMRILKNGGAFGYVDSLQSHDAGDLKWAIEQFPKDFHEPFFRSYIEHPMEKVFEDQGLVDVEKRTGFLSKALLGFKP